MSKPWDSKNEQLLVDRKTAEWKISSGKLLNQFLEAADVAADVGLGLNAGHDLDLHNLPRFASIPGLLEVSIGHALTVDAIRIGLENAVKAYQTALGK